MVDVAPNDLDEIGSYDNVWAIATYLRPDGWWAYVQNHQRMNIAEAGDDDRGGYESPSEAIEALLEALRNQDPTE